MAANEWTAERLAQAEQAAAAEVIAGRDAMLEAQGSAFSERTLQPEHGESLGNAQDRFEHACERHEELFKLRLASC
jgi:hypothetical protein